MTGGCGSYAESAMLRGGWGKPVGRRQEQSAGTARFVVYLPTAPADCRLMLQSPPNGLGTLTYN